MNVIRHQEDCPAPALDGKVPAAVFHQASYTQELLATVLTGRRGPSGRATRLAHQDVWSSLPSTICRAPALQ